MDNDIPSDACTDGLLSTAAAAKFLQVSKTYLYRLIKTGQLPATHLGAKLLVPRRALVAFCMRRTRVAKAARDE